MLHRPPRVLPHAAQRGSSVPPDRAADLPETSDPASRLSCLDVSGVTRLHPFLDVIARSGRLPMPPTALRTAMGTAVAIPDPNARHSRAPHHGGPRLVDDRRYIAISRTCCVLHDCIIR